MSKEIGGRGNRDELGQKLDDEFAKLLDLLVTSPQLETLMDQLDERGSDLDRQAILTS